MNQQHVYSFDIFDTVLVRIWARPTDLFWQLGWLLNQEKLIQISPHEWQSFRINSEAIARKSLPHGEVTIQEIYQQLAFHFSWSTEQTQLILQKELELELQSLYPVPSISKKIQELRANNNKIFFLSDMYLLEEEIYCLLRGKNIWHHGDTLYVSSRWKMSKATGKLFHYCLQKEALSPSQIKHMGDNHHSDVSIPQRLGIQSELFDQTHLNRYEQRIADSSTLPIKFRSLLAGISRLTRLHAPDLEPDHKTIWDTSANVVAPVLFGFVHWCLVEAQKKGIQRLYFVARDGQILQKIAQIICKSWSYDIDCRYLYGSRQAWHFPAILQIGETELDWIFDPTQFLSVRSVCERVSLVPGQIVDSLQQFGFYESAWDANLTSNQRHTLRQVFSQQAVVDLIIDAAATYREKAIGYFRQEGMGDPVRFAIVDIGWHGRLQCSLSKLLSSADLYPQNGLVGFYFSLLKRIKINPKDQLLSYFSYPDFPSIRYSLSYFSYPDFPSSRYSLYQFRALYELFVTADHGGTMMFDQINDQYVPVLFYDKNHKAINWGLLTQQKAVCEFTRQFTQHLKSQDFFSEDYLLTSEMLLHEFIYHPSLKEAEVYGSFLFAEDQAENILYELAPSYKFDDCLKLLIRGLQPHQNTWFYAAKTRSSMVSNMLLNKKIIAIAFRLQALRRRVKKFFLRQLYKA